MQIGKNWRIESDDLNVTLLERGERTNKETGEKSEVWKAQYYYSTVAAALKGLVEIRVKRTGLKDVETVVAEIDKLKGEIDASNC